MDLQTTNWLLGVIAVASAVQMLAIIAAVIFGAYKFYRQTTETMEELQQRHIAPLREQVERILADVHAITARVSQQTERADQAISSTIGRVDETAERVKHSVRDKVSQATGVVRGVRAIITALLATDTSGKPRAEASGRA